VNATQRLPMGAASTESMRATIDRLLDERDDAVRAAVVSRRLLEKERGDASIRAGRDHLTGRIDGTRAERLRVADALEHEPCSATTRPVLASLASRLRAGTL
jgi:hypothetical protein